MPCSAFFYKRLETKSLEMLQEKPPAKKPPAKKTPAKNAKRQHETEEKGDDDVGPSVRKSILKKGKYLSGLFGQTEQAK